MKGFDETTRGTVGHARRLPPFLIGLPLLNLQSDPVVEALVGAMADRARESQCFRARALVEGSALEDSGTQGGLSPLLKGLERRRLLDVTACEMGEGPAPEGADEIDIALVPATTGRYGGLIRLFRDRGAAIVRPSGPEDLNRTADLTFSLFATGVPRPEELRNAIESAAASLMSARPPSRNQAQARRGGARNARGEWSLSGP